MSKRTTIRLPEELLNRARRKAAAEGRTLSSLIEDGLRSVVSEPKKTDGRQAALLARVSKATGGPMPGIDLADLSAVQEIDDLEQLDRMQRFK